MTVLEQIATAAGLGAQVGPTGELRAECEEGRFSELASAIAAQALLSDLFASTGPGGPAMVTAVFSAAGDPGWLLLSTRPADGRFPSLTPTIHVASWYEREIHEMFGLEPEGHPAPVGLRLYDWPEGLPPMTADAARLREVPGRADVSDRVPTVQGQGVFQLPLGPVRSGPQESGEFLFNSGGEDLVMVSPRLGYKFRAVERLAEGRSVEDGILLAERLAGTSSFSNALAFTQAAERALGVEPPEGALVARTLMNELERLHSHFGNLGRVADATGLAVGAAQYAMLKEEVLRTCGRLSGHRYLRGTLSLGGLHVLEAEGLKRVDDGVARWRRRAARLEELLEDSATFIDRLDTTAVLPPDYAAQHNLVGPIGRSTGADRDARRDHPYAAYRGLSFEVPVELQGDALARVRVLLAEVGQSLDIVEQLAGRAGPASTPPEPGQSPRPGSAMGWAEAPGGETLHYLELDEGGRIRRWRARPPACVNWHPFAYACASGNNLTDFPVIEASFGLSHAEFDR